MPGGRERDRGYLRAAALAVALAFVAFFIWIAIRIGGARLTDAVDDIGELVAALIAAALCALTAGRRPEVRRPWSLLALSSFSWAAGETVWCYYDLVRGVTVPFPSLADVGFLLAVPPAAAGLLLLPGALGSGVSRLRSLLDGLLIASAVLFLSWETVLGAVYRQHSGGVFAQAVGLAYPAGDIVLVSLVVIVGTRPGAAHRGALWLVGMGMLSFSLSDSSFAYLTALNRYGIGNLFDAGWVLGYLLIALGALHAGHTSPVDRSSRVGRIGSGEEGADRRTSQWTVIGPFVPLSLGAGVFLWGLVHGQTVSFAGQIVAFVMIASMSVRQIIVLLDNVRLNQRLESRIEERTAELHHQAYHDALTGLANRALFNQFVANTLQRRARSGAAVAVLFVDLDDFKEVNDLHGHGAGDELLRSVAARLAATVRDGDIVARLGGDEFAVLLEDEPLGADAATVAARILERLAEPIEIDGTHISVDASIGVARDGGEGWTAEELLRNADLAMYAAKAKGGSAFEVYAPEMHSVILERMRIEAELRAGLDHDEFVVHYQPIVDLATDTVYGLEALIRWNHPRRGFVSPDQFIPVAEACGMIIPIGAWVLGQACRDMTVLHGDNPDLWLSVNLSTRQLDDPGLLDVVTGALSESGLDPTRLTLEVTESALMDDVESAVVVLNALRGLGVKIAIDDFGTGYSSLSTLRDLPVDTLKIDKSFVGELSRDRASADVTRRILQLAADFRLRTVAEGVEAEDQLEVLRSLGCDAVQGFYFSKARTPAELGDLLAGPAGLARPARPAAASQSAA